MKLRDKQRRSIQAVADEIKAFKTSEHVTKILS